MPPSLPTPFDITDIPHIAWQPGASSWLVVGAMLVLAAFIVLMRSKRPKGPRNAKVVELLLSEIQKASAITSTNDAQRLSHLVRRVVEYLSDVELSSLSAGELEIMSKTATPDCLAQTLGSLAALESSVYAPPSAAMELSPTASALVSSLKEYVEWTRRR